ncbi:MAG: FtsW/RodA/SpoVE family cell cycle protein, partial [Dehalococcoidia bacterium]
MITQVARRAVPDPALILAVIGLIAGGALMVRAATMVAPGEVSAEAWRQITYAFIGLLLLLLVSRVHLGVIQRLAPFGYALSIGSLIAVLALGSDQFGARRWIELAPGVTVQPSEFAKIATVLAVASYAANRDPGIRAMLTSLGL